MSAQRIAMLIACVTVGPFSPLAQACGFSESAGKITTFRQKAATNKIVLFGRVENAKEGPDGGSTDFVIIERIKTDPVLGNRQVIRLPRYIPIPDPKNPPTFLVFGDVSDGKPDIHTGEQLTRAVLAYLNGATAIDGKDKVNVMRYAFDFLDHADPAIASDAYGEFMTSTDPDIRTAARSLSPNKLRDWLRNELTSAARLRLYAYLLGNCGNKEDAVLLRKLLDHHVQQEGGTPLVDGILTGYTLLDPKAGWAYCCDLLKQQTVPFTAQYSALRAARYFRTTHPGVVTDKEILTLIAFALEQDDIADIAIDYLREWQCWELTDPVLAAFGKDDSQGIVRRVVVRYALQCPDPKAARFIAELRKIDPKRVERAEAMLKETNSNLTPPQAPMPRPHADDKLEGLRLDGDKFTFEEGKLTFRGILMKPDGKGPFPAVLISHGLGSNGEQFGRLKAKEFVRWGFVCIAPDYAHSDPKGDRKDFGASAENIRRAKKCLDILQAQPDVDPKKLCAYGNSMGAFLTIGLAAEEPERLVAAAITAGGINPVAGFPAPSKEQAAKIKTPFCVLHGTKDTSVPPERSQLFEDVLKENKITYERHLFEGVGHDLHTAKAKEVNAKIEKWFRKHTKAN